MCILIASCIFCNPKVMDVHPVTYSTVRFMKPAGVDFVTGASCSH